MTARIRCALARNYGKHEGRCSQRTRVVKHSSTYPTWRNALEGSGRKPPSASRLGSLYYGLWSEFILSTQDVIGPEPNKYIFTHIPNISLYWTVVCFVLPGLIQCLFSVSSYFLTLFGTSVIRQTYGLIFDSGTVISTEEFLPDLMTTWCSVSLLYIDNIVPKVRWLV